MTEQLVSPETPTPPKSRAGLLLPILVAAVLIVALVSCFFSVRTSRDVRQVMETQGISADGQTREDDVAIMGEYYIRSTLPISDAYKSGDDSKLDSKEKETLEMASAVLDEIITEDMTDYEKELAVYEWMTTSLQYDTGVLQVIPNTQADCDNPYGVLKYHNAVCVGYATTFRLFMQMLDLPCMVVHNTEKYHSWDLIQLDGDWYHVDIYSDQNSGNYANFNMNDEMCSQGHDWDREFYPAAEGTKYNYAIQNAVPVGDIYTVPALVREALDDETGNLFLSFDPIDEAHAQIVETMMDGIRSCMEEGDDYSSMWMNWTWLHVTGNQYVLAVYMESYDDDSSDFDISDEDRAKIDEAIAESFGTAPDWDDVDYESSRDEGDAYCYEETVTVG